MRLSFFYQKIILKKLVTKLINCKNFRHEKKCLAIAASRCFATIGYCDLIESNVPVSYLVHQLKDKKKITACRTLKEIEEQLQSFSSFLRVHHSYVVNLNEVTKSIRGEGGYLVMSDGSTVNVSRSRREALSKLF